jgi:hypothetical protein
MIKSIGPSISLLGGICSCWQLSIDNQITLGSTPAAYWFHHMPSISWATFVEGLRQKLFENAHKLRQWEHHCEATQTIHTSTATCNCVMSACSDLLTYSRCIPACSHSKSVFFRRRFIVAVVYNDLQIVVPMSTDCCKMKLFHWCKFLLSACLCNCGPQYLFGCGVMWTSLESIGWRPSA